MESRSISSKMNTCVQHGGRNYVTGTFYYLWKLRDQMLPRSKKNATLFLT